MLEIKKNSVLGLGKLGACMAATFAQRGFEVIGVDINPETSAASMRANLGGRAVAGHAGGAPAFARFDGRPGRGNVRRFDLYCSFNQHCRTEVFPTSF